MNARWSSGLPLGGAALVVAGLVIALSFLWLGGTGERKVIGNSAEGQGSALSDVFDDRATLDFLATLKRGAPLTAQKLEREGALALRSGADKATLSDLVLRAAFAQYREQAFDLQYAPIEAYDQIISELSNGAAQLKSVKSEWCTGPHIAAFLTQSDDELLPSLLQELPYGSAQYDWFLRWNGLFIQAGEQARLARTRHGRPTQRDEFALQQQGRALGSQQWGLALQIAAFANAEGQSYEAMQDAIEAINVCDLGIAIQTVSSQLPADVKGRIWADLMPEIMVGNTPYALARIQDYFFIG